MTLLTGPGEGHALGYAGQVMRALAGWNGEPEGLAVIEMTVPARFAGPIPHAHDAFDESLYILDGALRVIGDHRAADTPAAIMWTRIQRGVTSLRSAGHHGEPGQVGRRDKSVRAAGSAAGSNCVKVVIHDRALGGAAAPGQRAPVRGGSLR